MNKKNIVIVGAGFAGLHAYKNLIKTEGIDDFTVTIIDKNNHFLFTPLLHEVATGSLQQDDVVEPIRSLIDTRTRFIQSCVKGINLDEKKIVLENDSISYDYLILGTGAQSQFYGVKGAQDYAYTLKTLSQATKLKNRFIDQFEKATREKDSEKRKKALSFVIIGAGPTGVELVGETADLFFHTLKKYYGNLFSRGEVSLHLISGGNTVLARYKESLQVFAKNILLKNNVTIHFNTRISEIGKDFVLSEKGEKIETETVVWAAGVSAKTDFIVGDNIKRKSGRIVIDGYLRAPSYPEVFVLGDISHSESAGDRGYPMTAQLATQQGKYLGKNFYKIIKDEAKAVFIYNERGSLASLGNKKAIADLGVVAFSGYFAWFLWRTIYLLNFISWRKRFQIMFSWAIHLFTERDITKM